MGALHAGHFALVRMAQRRADRVIVSIFVNPTQFAPNEDLGPIRGPLPPISRRLPSSKADLVWAPVVATMYPDGFATRIVPGGPAKAGLEDAFRPHFFAGVATVVAKLLIQCEPDFALFGEKDYQQLKVVTQLARDLGLQDPHRRRADRARSRRPRAVLAQSLPVAGRARSGAGALPRAQGLRGEDRGRRAARRRPRTTAAPRSRDAGFALDYLEARHAETLAPLASQKTNRSGSSSRRGSARRG